MKKKYTSTDLDSTVRCRVCGKSIKTRLVKTKKHIPEECYVHYVIKHCKETGRKLPEKIVRRQQRKE